MLRIPLKGLFMRRSRLLAGVFKNLFQLFAIALLSLGLIYCQHNPTDTEVKDQTIASFAQKTDELIATIQTSTDANLIKQKASEVKKIGFEVASKYGEIYPNCDQYLKASFEGTSDVSKMSLAELEENYRKKAALPSAPNGCDPAKDLIVYPASVEILSRELDKAQARQEMIEKMQQAADNLKIVEEFIRVKKTNPTSLQ